MRSLAHEKVETVFKLLDESTEVLKKTLDSSYLDAFIETGENLLDNKQVQVEDGKPDAAEVQQLDDIYQQLDLDNIDSETFRSAIQLCMLKAIKEDHIQANHQMTPDTIGILMASLIEKVTHKSEIDSIFDLAVGTGNLLTTVMNHLASTNQAKLHGYGIDNDDSLLAVASVSTALQKLPVDLYHQDAIDSLDIGQCDIVVSDLPVGYYPLDDNVKNYETSAKKGHSYVHHLLIEQAINYLKPGGFGVFLVPSNVFQTNQTDHFVEWIQSHAHLQGIINLPTDLFTNQQSQKSILLIQRGGGNSAQAKKVLLGEFPSLKDQRAFTQFMQEIDEWVTTNLNV